MKQRDRVTMTEAEVSALLAGSRKLQLATINRDGTPHLVTMFYVMLGGQIAFWTYRASQKARNLARDPRITCLVETGEDYFELRGVQVAGRARCVEDPAGGAGDRPQRGRQDGRGTRRGAGGIRGAHRPQASGIRGRTGQDRLLGPSQAHPVPQQLTRRPGRRVTIERTALDLVDHERLGVTGAVGVGHADGASARRAARHRGDAGVPRVQGCPSRAPRSRRPRCRSSG